MTHRSFPPILTLLFWLCALACAVHVVLEFFNIGPHTDDGDGLVWLAAMYVFHDKGAAISREENSAVHP